MEGAHQGHSFVGTTPYMAPEIYRAVLDPSQYTKAVDIWAVGCIACRMLIGTPPFENDWVLGQYTAAIRNSQTLDDVRKAVKAIPESLARLLEAKTGPGKFVRRLLEPTPEKRLSASGALNYPWIRGIG